MRLCLNKLQEKPNDKNLKTIDIKGLRDQISQAFYRAPKIELLLGLEPIGKNDRENGLCIKIWQKNRGEKYLG